MRSSARTPDDTPALLGDLIRFGTVETADLDAREYTVKCGDVTSPPIRRLSLAGALSSWTPLSVGEQVVLLCAEGDIEHAVIIGSLESDTFPAPASGRICMLKMPDGSEIWYDPDTEVMTLNLIGEMRIMAPSGVTIIADVDITGKLTVSETIDAQGLITSAEDVKADGISLKEHKHGGVSAGLAKTAVPE